MINNIEVQNFKRFKKPVKIKGLSKINYLVGKNNIGKSSFLQAALLSTLYRNENGINFRNNHLPEKFARLKEYFNDEDLTNQIKVVFDTDSGRTEVSGVWGESSVSKSKTGDGRIPRTIYIPCGISMDMADDKTSFNILDNTLKQFGILPIQNINSWVFHHERRTIGGVFRSGESEQFKKLKSIMKDKFSVEILQPSMDNDNNFHFRYLENNKEKNLYLLGGGAQNILYFIAVIVYSKNYDLVLIDEPELHLHPEIQKKLSLIFKELADQFNIQLIIATQSPFIINSLHADDNVYILKDENTQIIAKKEDSSINVAVAMELGCEPSDVGAPENFILVEEASMETLLLKVNDRFFKKNIQFIACFGINDIPDKELSIKNLISHNLLLKCTPIYLDKYFIVTDKLTDEIKKDARVCKIKNKLSDRFIELDDNKVEDAYPEKYLDNFVNNNPEFADIKEGNSRIKIENWIERLGERGKRKRQLADFIGVNITKEDFQSSFPKLPIIFR